MVYPKILMGLPTNSIPQIEEISRKILDNLKEITHTKSIYKFVYIRLWQTFQLKE